MRLLARTALPVLLLAALAASSFFSIGPERLWRAFGPADQGAVDFARLARRTVPNDSLACSPALCGPKADFLLPLYPVAPEELMAALDAAVLADPNVTRVDDGRRLAYRRYVARTPLMRFPDTVDALAEPVPGSPGSGLRLYGRSLVGRGDWGVNRDRLEGWSSRLSKILGLRGARPPAVS